MKSVGLYLLLLLSYGLAWCQQEPLFSQFSTNPYLIQPAEAGRSLLTEARASYRTQWGNFPGNPRTLTASLHGAFNEKNGAGFMFIRDELGVSKIQKIQLSYAFHIPMARDSQRVSLGAGLSFASFRVNTDRIYFQDRNDAAIQTVGQNFSAADLVFGVQYTDERTYIGISSPNLIRTGLTSGNDPEIISRLYRTLYLMGGHRFPTNTFTIEPSLLLKISQGIPAQVEGNVKLHFVEGRIMFGAGARSGFRGIIMAGFKTPNNLRILYIADFPAASTGQASRIYGITNEIMLGFDLVKKAL